MAWKCAAVHAQHGLDVPAGAEGSFCPFSVTAPKQTRWWGHQEWGENGDNESPWLSFFFFFLPELLALYGTSDLLMKICFKFWILKIQKMNIPGQASWLHQIVHVLNFVCLFFWINVWNNKMHELWKMLSRSSSISLSWLFLILALGEWRHRSSKWAVLYRQEPKGRVSLAQELLWLNAKWGTGWRGAVVSLSFEKRGEEILFWCEWNYAFFFFFF